MQGKDVQEAMERILILGAGPQARVIPDVIALCPCQELIGFVDEAGERPFLKECADRFPVYDLREYPDELKSGVGDFFVLIATRFPELRAELLARTQAAGLSLANIVHPSVLIAGSARLGRGLLLMPYAIIGSGADIGDTVIVNSASTIDHDCILEQGVVLAPGVHLAGGVRVGSGTAIGVGACVSPGVAIGRNSLIGAGSVVTKDIPDGVVAAGVPARVLRSVR